MDTTNSSDSRSGPSVRTAPWVAVLEPLLVCTGLTLAVSHRSFEPIWRVSSGLLVLGSLTGIAYLAGYTVSRLSRQRGVGRTAVIAAVASGPILFTLLALGLPASRYALVFELALLWTFLGLAATRLPHSFRLLTALLFAGFAAYPTLIGITQLGGASTSFSSDDVEYVFTSYHDLRIAKFRVLEGDLQYGGAMTLVPDGRVLLVAGSGDATLLDLGAGDGVNASRIDLELPIDVSGYYSQARSPTWFYRVTDVLYSDGHLLATYTHWDSERDCYTMRLMEAEFRELAVGPWTTRFESQPCVAMERLNNESAGRLASLDESHILLTMGHFGRRWDEESNYSKILMFDRETWHSQIFTRGHRNPQGLLVSSDGIWSTEHGPHGGDELNRIEQGLNYGWPSVSYGTDYGKKTLASGRTPGDHSGFAAPIYTWTPSVGISNLIQLSGGAFPNWKGDLLVGSLTGLGNGHALFRVRILQGRAVNVERIPIGSPVRDLVELAQGEVVLWDGHGMIQVIRPADHVFAQCAGCHNIRNNAHGIGPDLAGVVGSPVGRHTDYEYSEAMRTYGGRWSATRLNRFLRNPQDEIPGTSMEGDGIEDPAARAEIIEFLSEISGGAPRGN
jgi:cytochrome c2